MKTTIQITNPRTVNVKRFVVKSNDNQYLKNLNGDLTSNIMEAYQFKRIPKARFYGKKFSLYKICSCNVEQIRETSVEFDVFHK